VIPGTKRTRRADRRWIDRIILCPRGPFAIWRASGPRRYRQKKIDAAGLLRHWFTRVTCEGMTLGGLLSILEKLSPPDLKTLEFATRRSVRPFLEEFGRAVVNPLNSRSRITLLEVSREITWASWRHTALPERSALPEMSIDTKCVAREGTRRTPRGGWSLSFIPASRLRDAEIVICREGALIHEKQWTCLKRARFRLKLTVGEVVEAILSELTFHGTPAERDRSLAELRRLEAKAASGRTKGTPLDQLMKEAMARWKKERPAAEKLASALWRARHRGEKNPAPADGLAT
jgi:hypothetical protein